MMLKKHTRRTNAYDKIQHFTIAREQTMGFVMVYNTSVTFVHCKVCYCVVCDSEIVNVNLIL